MACRVVAFVFSFLVVVSAGCTVDSPAFGASCAADVDCGAGLVCAVDVCVPGAAAGTDAGPEPDAGVDPETDGGVDVDAGPDPIDAGPEPLVFNRAPRAFATTVVVAANAVATVTLQGSDPDGDALTFSVAADATTGGVTLDGATATVTALAADGAFTFTVSDGALSDTATVVVKLATPSTDESTTTFIGNNGDSWNDAASWSRGVPGQAVFNVVVPAGKVVVVQNAPSALINLDVENGAVVELGSFSFTATQVRVGGEIRCTASPCIRATRAAGRLPSWQANDFARLDGPVLVEGKLVTAFDLQVQDHPLTVLGGVDVDGLVQQLGSVLHIEGSVAMDANITLADGVWSLRGSLVRLRGALTSTGTHRLLLDAAESQSVSVGEGGCFNDVEILTPALTLAANLATCGRTTVRGGAAVTGSAQLDVTGPFVLEDGGRIAVAELRPRGTVALSGDGFDVPVVRIGAGLTVPDLPFRDLLVSGNGQVSLVDDITVAGALRSVFNDPIEIVIGEATLTLDTLALLSPSRFSMVFPDAKVVVAGDASLAPSNGATMSNGVIEVGGNLRFDNGSTVRYGDGQHTWRLTGQGTLTSATATALVGRIEVADGASLTIGDGTTPLTFEPTTALTVNGALTIPATTTLRLVNGTTVTCGPNGSVTLTGLCTRNDQPCPAICP